MGCSSGPIIRCLGRGLGSRSREAFGEEMGGFRGVLCRLVRGLIRLDLG